MSSFTLDNIVVGDSLDVLHAHYYDPTLDKILIIYQLQVQVKSNMGWFKVQIKTTYKSIDKKKKKKQLLAQKGLRKICGCTNKHMVVLPRTRSI